MDLNSINNYNNISNITSTNNINNINNTNNINILQYNTVKNALIQETLLEIGKERNTNIIIIQEPRIFNKRDSIQHPAYISTLPYKENPRVLIYIKKERKDIKFNLRLDLSEDPDLLILEINSPYFLPFYIINIYNELNINNKGKKERTIERALISLKLDKLALIAGDFNTHYPLQNTSINHPIRARNLVKQIKKNNLEILNILDLSTFFRPDTRAKSIIDLTLANKYLSNRIYNQEILEEKSGSDHEIISFFIRGAPRSTNPGPILSTPSTTPSPPNNKDYNLKKIDWELFKKGIKEKVQNSTLFNSSFFKALKEEDNIYTLLNIDINKGDTLIPYLEDLAINLTNLIKDLLEEIAPLRKNTSFSKKWWNPALKNLRKELARTRRIYKSTRLLEDFNSYKEARNLYFREIKKAKAKSQITYLESIDSKSIDIYKLLKIIDKKDYIIPTIIYKEKERETKANSFKEKSSLFKKVLFPKPPPSKVINLDYYLGENQEWPSINSSKISLAINTSNTKKAPGPDNISFLIIKEVYKAIPDLFNKVFKLLLNNSYQPLIQREAIGVIIPKPNKEDKKDPKAYRPISLLNYLGKILEKIIATRLGNLANSLNTPFNLLHPS